MGNKQPKAKHILHFHRLDENKLWLFYPESESYSCYPVYNQNGPFFFGNLETVGVPSLNSIFIIGGTGFRAQPQFIYTEDPFNARMGEDGYEMPGNHTVS